MSQDEDRTQRDFDPVVKGPETVGHRVLGLEPGAISSEAVRRVTSTAGVTVSRPALDRSPPTLPSLPWLPRASRVEIKSSSYGQDIFEEPHDQPVDPGEECVAVEPRRIVRRRTDLVEEGIRKRRDEGEVVGLRVDDQPRTASHEFHDVVRVPWPAEDSVRSEAVVLR